MSTSNKKAPGRDPRASHNTIESYSTSIKGRRAISHLWTASRAVAGASLTPDDKALIAEALAEISGVAK